MKINDKEKAELSKWNMMQKKGKKRYILREGLLYWGLLMGIWWAFVVQLVEEGFKFNSLTHPSFLRRLLIALVLFSIAGYFNAHFTWRRYKKKYSKNN